MRRDEALKVVFWVSPGEAGPLIVPSQKSPNRPIGTLNRELAGTKEALPQNEEEDPRSSMRERRPEITGGLLLQFPIAPNPKQPTPKERKF